MMPPFKGTIEKIYKWDTQYIEIRYHFKNLTGHQKMENLPSEVKGRIWDVYLRNIDVSRNFECTINLSYLTLENGTIVFYR